MAEGGGMTDAALRAELSDAECNAIYYARARAIARGEQPGSGDGVERDRDLIRWAFRAGIKEGRRLERAAAIEDERSAATEAMWKERQGDEYGSY